MTDILAQINDIVAFALIFEKFGTTLSENFIDYEVHFNPVVASFIDFFDDDSPAAEVVTEALIALNTEINMINFIATAKLSVGKFCEGFVENDELEEFRKTFTCICMDTFELTLDSTGYGTCACASGETNVDGVCVKDWVESDIHLSFTVISESDILWLISLFNIKTPKKNNQVASLTRTVIITGSITTAYEYDDELSNSNSALFKSHAATLESELIQIYSRTEVITEITSFKVNHKSILHLLL